MRGRAAVLTAVTVPIFGLLGLGTSSAAALPGDTLYPVKRGVENAQLALQRGDSDRGTFELKLATKRLEETSGLTKRPGTTDALAADTLSAYSAQADEGSKALVRSFRDDGNREDIVTLNRFANTAYRGLTSLDGRLDGPAATVLASAQKQLSAIVEQSTRLCSDCAGIGAGLVNAILGPPAASPAAPNPSVPGAATPPGTQPAATAESGSESASESTSEDDSEDSTREPSSDDGSAPVAANPDPADPESDEPDPPAQPDPPSDDSRDHTQDGHGKDADHTNNGKGNG